MERFFDGGTILWSTDAPYGSFAYGPVTIANGVMFGAALGTPLGALLALEATTGKVLWQYKVNSTLAGRVSVLKVHMLMHFVFQFKSSNKFLVVNCIYLYHDMPMLNKIWSLHVHYDAFVSGISYIF
jgi:hypothetical protein